MITFELLHPRVTEEYLGFLPDMLDPDDPRPAREQIDSNYRHGGGWSPFNGHLLLANNHLHYPGDPPLAPIAQTRLRDELIVVFEHDWVAIIQPDRSYEVARID